MNGIKRQLTASYTPQQNGVAERKNRTIVEMAKSFLKGKGLPNMFWAEAVATAVYLFNRSPTKAVKKRIPYKAWSGRKAEVSHFRIFGSIAYVHIPSEKRKEFYDKSEKFLFIGYSNETKGVLYKILINKILFLVEM